MVVAEPGSSVASQPTLPENCEPQMDSEAWYADMMEQKRMLALALGRLLHRQLAMALNRWKDWYDDMLRQKRLLAGATQSG